MREEEKKGKKGSEKGTGGGNRARVTPKKE